MRRCLATALLAATLLSPSASAQVLDETVVPRGRLRLQAHPVFSTWDSRFGIGPDGIARREPLGADLTDATALGFFPGVPTMASLLEDASGLSNYDPTLGATEGRVTKEVTRIDFGGHLGVFDWLTIGVVVPWMRTRTVVDFAFAPDTVGGADLGLNPALVSAATVETYLASLASSAAAAAAYAESACAGGPGATCDAAQALAGRAVGFSTVLDGAYAASPFFPLPTTTIGIALNEVSATLDADLVAAGLPGFAPAVPFAAEPVSEELFDLLPVTSGAGIEGSELVTRQSLWQTGDMEISALVRLLEGGPGGGQQGSQPSYRVVLGLLARLPTGTPQDPDVFLDIGTGDGQTDFEGRLNGSLRLGRVGLAAGGRYGIQQPTELVRRVARHEVAMPPIATRHRVRWEPGSYLGVDVAPTFRLTEELWLVGEYRYFHKGGDEYALVDPVTGLDAGVLGAETSVTAHRVGGGLRFSTVEKWAAGIAPRPFELHLRWIRTIAGAGGQTPVTTRVEAGIRLFRRFWGPQPGGG